ncbi:MAG: hypothetical protein AB7N71_15325, partial [Phycisphaerae bacterium]
MLDNSTDRFTDEQEADCNDDATHLVKQDTPIKRTDREASHEIEVAAQDSADQQVLVSAVRALGDRITGHLKSIEDRLARTEARVGQLERSDGRDTLDGGDGPDFAGEIDLRDNEVRAMREIHRVIDLCRGYQQKAVAAEKFAENVTSSVTHMRDKITFLEAELERKQKEVRYQIGDAFVKASRPSRETLALPVRLWKLFRQG